MALNLDKLLALFTISVDQYLTNKPPTLTTKLKHLLILFQLFLGKLRLFTVAFCISTNRTKVYLPYDPFTSVFYYQIQITDSFLYLAFSLNGIVALFVHWHLHYTDRFGPTLGLLAKLVTVRKRKEIFQKFSKLQQILQHLKELWNVLHHRQQLDFTVPGPVTSELNRLTYFNRRVLYLLWKVAQVNFFLVNTFSIFMFTAFISGYYLDLLGQLCLLGQLAVMADLVGIFYLITSVTKQFLFLFYLITILTTASLFQLKHLNGRLVEQIQYRKSCVYRICQALESYRFEHTRLILFLTSFNHHVVSQFSLIYLCSTFTFNVYTLVYLHFRALTSFAQATFYFFISSGLLYPLPMMYQLIGLNRRLVETSGGIVGGLLRLRSSDSRKSKWIQAELGKSAIYFELLNHQKRPYTMSASVFGEFSHRLVLRFIFLYFLYLKKAILAFQRRDLVT